MAVRFGVAFVSAIAAGGLGWLSFDMEAPQAWALAVLMLGVVLLAAAVTEILARIDERAGRDHELNVQLHWDPRNHVQVYVDTKIGTSDRPTYAYAIVIPDLSIVSFEARVTLRFRLLIKTDPRPAYDYYYATFPQDYVGWREKRRERTAGQAQFLDGPFIFMNDSNQQVKRGDIVFHAPINLIESLRKSPYWSGFDITIQGWDKSDESRTVTLYVGQLDAEHDVEPVPAA
jgi:hypothetical protein